jgi:hypothetical protein
MNEKNIIDMFKAGHSIKYILKKAKASDKVFNSPNSEDKLLKNIEEAILKYWKEG